MRAQWLSTLGLQLDSGAQPLAQLVAAVLLETMPP
ncbi:MAG: hypothetical protein ACI9S9_004947, partial [Planctomycetota bacterium]